MGENLYSTLWSEEKESFQSRKKTTPLKQALNNIKVRVKENTGRNFIVGFQDADGPTRIWHQFFYIAEYKGPEILKWLIPFFVSLPIVLSAGPPKQNEEKPPRRYRHVFLREDDPQVVQIVRDEIKKYSETSGVTCSFSHQQG